MESQIYDGIHQCYLSSVGSLIFSFANFSMIAEITKAQVLESVGCSALDELVLTPRALSIVPQEVLEERELTPGFLELLELGLPIGKVELGLLSIGDGEAG